MKNHKRTRYLITIDSTKFAEEVVWNLIQGIVSNLKTFKGISLAEAEKKHD